jgi:hypothetical protein
MLLPIAKDPVNNCESAKTLSPIFANGKIVPSGNFTKSGIAKLIAA